MGRRSVGESPKFFSFKLTSPKFVHFCPYCHKAVKVVHPSARLAVLLALPTILGYAILFYVLFTNEDAVGDKGVVGWPVAISVFLMIPALLVYAKKTRLVKDERT